MSFRTQKFLGLGLLLALGGLLGTTSTAASADSAPQRTAKAAASDMTMYVTLYGYVDNSPPSAIISNPQIHDQAGGTGTYSDPITFATDTREEAPGTIVYYGYLKKYFIMEDTCAECSTDWDGGNGDNPTQPVGGHYYRIDLWAGGDSSDLSDPGKSALLNCEDNLTQDNGGTVTLDPPSDEPVDPTPIFDTSTNECHTP